MPTPEDEERFLKIGREIAKKERLIKKHIKPHKKLYESLLRSEREWMKLQGKETVYKADVELDQIMTFFRIGYVNLCSYLVHEMLDESSMSLAKLLQNILQLSAIIEETPTQQEITLKYNRKDRKTMASLERILKKFNEFNVTTLDGKRMKFKLGEFCDN